MPGDGAHESWLIRTAENQILGPISRDEMISRIQNRQIGRADEICPNNGYWFFLYEGEEIEHYLGIRLPATEVDTHGEEATETGSRTVTDTLTQPIQRTVTSQPFVLGKVEKTSLWKIIAAFLGLSAIALILIVLRMLRIE